MLDVTAHIETARKAVAGTLARYGAGNRADADDLTQDALIKVLENAHRFDSERGTPAAFVAKVAQTTVLDMLRKRGRRGVTSATMDDGSVLEPGRSGPRCPLVRRCRGSTPSGSRA